MHESPTPVPGFKERYAVLLDVAGILTGTLRPDDLYRTIYEQASRVLETTGFYISLYDPASDVATVVFYADRGEISHVQVTYRGSESIAIREKRPVLEDMNRREHAILLLGSDDEEVTRAGISAPMMREGRVLGVISAQSYSAGAYGADDLQLLNAVADLAAVAFENAHYVQETEHRRREAERLEEIGRAITSSLELQEVLRRVTDAVLDLVDAETATVWLLRGEDDEMIEIAMAAGEGNLPVGEAFPFPAGFRQRLVDERRSLVLEHVTTHPLLAPELRRRIGVQTLVAVPLIAEDRVIGALSAGHIDVHEYEAEDIRLLERLGYQAAVAVENARLHKQIRTLSLTDPLTELPNRRHLEMVLDKEFAAARRGRQLAVVLFDLDYFKRYNDAAGHQAGDDALRRFGRILTAQTRSMNLAARYGGDEFISVLSDAGHEGALLHVRRIGHAVDHDDVLGDIGVSAGIAIYGSDMAGPEDLIRSADADLYRRKENRDADG